MSHQIRALETYFFDSLESKVPSSSRKVYIRRVVDILQMSIHQRDWRRARRAWSILVRCPEFEWKKLWRTGLLLIQCADSTTDPASGRCLEYLRVMMLRAPEHRVDILQEIILWLIQNDRHSDALDELELYLPSFPYQDNAVLHIYAGLLYLFLAYPQRVEKGLTKSEHATAPTASSVPLKQAYVRDCRAHLRRAAELDPEHPLPPELLSRITSLETEDQKIELESEDASDVDVDEDDGVKPLKRLR